MFETKGIIRVDKDNFDEEELFLVTVEAGAEDMKSDDEDYYDIYTEADQLGQVQADLEKNNVIVVEAERTMIPKTTVNLEEKAADQMLKLMDVLDDHDDIQNVYANFDIDDEILSKVSE
jgi:transcriptional/translational regulatory protein YebC/TACO1